MLTKYAPRFSALTETQNEYLLAALESRYPSAREAQGESIYQICENAGLDQADVVMSLARDTTIDGIATIETLIDAKITRAAPKQKKTAAKAPRKPRRVGRDDRIVQSVAPNPKKPNSKSFARYALYEVGVSVNELRERGITQADLNWDTERGFVVLK